MKWARFAMPGATGVAVVLGASVAMAAPFKDQLVQAPSIGQPERGSIAGSLSQLAFGPAALARGLYSLPLPVDLPSERGPLLVDIIPSYSAEGGVGEWGVGWSTNLTIRRHRTVGEIDFTDDDELTSPWGKLVRGDDGHYYPAGLREMVRVYAVGDGWEVKTSDGTVYSFDIADADVTSQGTYGWHLSHVESLLGDSTTLTWTPNASGRAFLSEVRWGGRFDGTQYRASLSYDTLTTPFTSFVSGQPSVLDRRVSRVTTSVFSNGAYVERWRHDLAYQQSPTGPAFYLSQVTKTYASGQSEPPVKYQYDFSTDQLQSAAFEDAPVLDEYLGIYGSGGIQPDRAAMTDLERNGLTDMEVHLDQTLVRQTPDGYVFEPLPAPTGAEDPLCRPAVAATNKPRMLARMHGDATEPHVVVAKQNSTGTQTRMLICDRAGVPELDQWVSGAWAVGANTRLADADNDQRPDLVRVGFGTVQILRNTSASPEQLSFAPGPNVILSPKVTPVSSWVLDANGDGRPDLMVRHNSGVVVWRGIGAGRFEATGTPFNFTNAGGSPLAGLSTYEFSHGDFNNDGLSDLILTKGQQMILFTNRGSSFVETPVAAFATIPWTVSYPVVADLSGSGNEQVVMADGTQAKVLQLSRPSTGLLLQADDGKGTIIGFGYGRVRPVPGVSFLYSILESMTVTSSGYDTVTYDYDYGAPVWHSAGKFLVGFQDARKDSPFFHETVGFHNDDQIAGVITDTEEVDDRMPGILKFSERDLEPASFHGVPWLRLLSEKSGWRKEDGSEEVAQVTNVLQYDVAGVCPTVTETATVHGVQRVEHTLTTVPGLDAELSCLTRAQRNIGTHADASLDFDYRVELDRDDLGRLTKATQLGPDGPQVLQEVSYDSENHVASISAPGAGTSTFAYDPETGLLGSVVQPDGVVESVLARHPLTGGLVHTRLDRGDGASWSNFSEYDGLERLRSTWDDLSGASPVQPLAQYDYVWPTHAAPGRVHSRRLFDANSGAATTGVDVMAADGQVLARAALSSSGWSFGPVSEDIRNTREHRTYIREPMADVAGLQNGALTTGATLLGVEQATGAGGVLSTWNVVEENVTGTSTTARSIYAGQLIVTQTENGASQTRTGAGADGKTIWFEDGNGVVSSYVYDAMGRLRRVTSPSGIHRADFDGYGRPSAVERVGLKRVEWSYDAVTGAMTERREKAADGTLERSVGYEYDGIGRLVETVETKASTGATRVVTNGWDGAVPGGGTLPGQAGFSTSVVTDAMTKVVERTANNRVASTRWTLDDWRIVEQDQEYYADGALRSVTTRVADGNNSTLLETSKEYEYDAYGRLSIGRVDGVPLFHLSYDAYGRVVLAQLADGTLVPSHDPVTRARRGYALSGTVAGSVAWQRNARGLIASEAFALDGATLAKAYSYDARGFLVGAQVGGDHETYAYDEGGLLTTIADALGDRDIVRDASSIAAGGALHQLDGSGRIISRGDLTVEYGASGQIERAMRNGHQYTFSYDEAGQRVLKYQDGEPVAAYVGGGFLSEGGLLEPVEVAGAFVGVLDNGVFQRVAFDPRGTVISDDDGDLTLPSPYGVRLEHSVLAEAVEYVQKGYDRDLELVRMGVRDYDPVLGQFWTPDPLFMSEIDKCLGSPAECNLYGYARNNPISYVDPEGTEGVQNPVDTDREPKEVAYEESRAKMSRTMTGRPYEVGGGLPPGTVSHTAIDFAVTKEDIRKAWAAKNTVASSSWSLTGLVGALRSGLIPESDMKQIESHLRQLETGLKSWQGETKGGYVVRLRIYLPIAGELSEGGMTTEHSVKTSTGYTFTDKVESTSQIGAEVGGTYGPSESQNATGKGSFSHSKTKSHERSTTGQSEDGASVSRKYEFKNQAQYGVLQVGISRYGQKPIWLNISTSSSSESRQVIQRNAMKVE